LPDVPTVAEAAGLPAYENANWWSFLSAAGTPPAVVNKLTSEIKVILSLDDVQKWFVNAGGEVDYLGPAELRRFIQKEIANFKQIAREANLEEQR
jgi:tripartite-type tricarboxylate transporter receptor subunit TctC